MFRIPTAQARWLIVTFTAWLSIGAEPLHADELDDAIAAEEALQRELNAINGGALEFLAGRPAAVHSQRHRIIVTDSSLRDGWVGFEQCHDHLDAVAATEIVFHPERVRDLVVSSHADIARIVIDGSRVQLEEVGSAAHICITARSRALVAEGGGRFLLRNGPYMRRFLDGFYPLRLRMEVWWPAAALAFLGAVPQPQPGLAITTGADHLVLDASFRGRLTTELRFRDLRVSSLP